MEKLIITAAISGAELTREQQPRLPVTPAEIAAEARACREAGASIVHLHVRDQSGRPTQDGDCFRAAMEAIAAETDLIIQPSTGGAVGMSPAERLQPLSLNPEMATLTTGSVNFGREVFLNPLPEIEEFASCMMELGIKPELEVFDVGMVNNTLELFKKGLLREPLHFGFVMGVPGGIPGTARNLLHLVETIPQGSTWSVAGIGRAQLPLGIMATVWGGHVRVGFEDNIYYQKGILAESNAVFVSRMARIAAEAGRDIATPGEARKILCLKPAPS